VLSTLDDLTDFLSGEDYVSISSIRSVMKYIHEDALDERDDLLSATFHIHCPQLNIFSRL